MSPVTNLHGRGAVAGFGQGLFQTQLMHYTNAIGTELDAGTHFAECRGLFEQVDIERSASERERGCQATDPAPGDQYMCHGKPG